MGGEDELCCRTLYTGEGEDGNAIRFLGMLWRLAKGCVQAQLLSNHGPSTIWIDINDPINGTSFRSHPLKPIPVRMQGALTGSRSSQAQIVTAAPAAQPTEQATSTRMRASASASSDPPHVKEGTF